MAWGIADRNLMWGNMARAASWGAPETLNPDPNWPALPPTYAAHDAQLLKYAQDIRAFFLPGFHNPDIRQGLDHLELALRAQLAAKQAALGFVLLPPAAAPTHQAFYDAIDLARRRTPRAGGAAVTAAATPADLTHHLLRDCLVAGLQANGWWAPPIPMPVHTAIAFLPAAPFYGEMVLLQHLKDVTVGQEHGEWTHLLQWYLLAVWAPHPTFRTSSFFRFLGYQGPEQRAAPVTAPHDGGPTIWQVLFDRVAPYHHEANYLAAGVNDFSCPDMLHLSLAGWATNRGTIWGQVDTATPGLRGVLATNLAWAQTNWPLLTALLRHRMEKRTALFREADRADETLTAAVAELSAKLAALHRSDGTLLINIATSNVKAVLADRSQPFHAAQLTWNVPSLSAAERLGLNRLVEDHRKATERSAHLFHGNGRTKALLYAGSKLSPMALRNPVDWWRSLPPADQARLLGQSTQLFL